MSIDTKTTRMMRVVSDIVPLCDEVDALRAKLADAERCDATYAAAVSVDTKLAEAQAQNVALRAALIETRPWANRHSRGDSETAKIAQTDVARADAALAAKPDDGALKAAIGKAWLEGAAAAHREMLALLKAKPDALVMEALKAAIAEARADERAKVNAEWNKTTAIGGRDDTRMPRWCSPEQLHEFGLKVASRASDGQHDRETMAEVVDAVLRGER